MSTVSLFVTHIQCSPAKKTNLDDARDLSGVSSQQDPGIGRFANQKRRTFEQRTWALFGRKLIAGPWPWSVRNNSTNGLKAGGKQNLDDARDPSGVSSQRNPGLIGSQTKKTNLNDARDLSGVSSQQNSGIGRFANPRLRKDLTAVQTRGVLTAPTHQSLTP